MAVTIEEITWAFGAGNLSRDVDPEKLEEMVVAFRDFVKEARAERTAKMAKALAPGMRVKVPTKRGASMEAVIVKLKRTRAIVETDDGKLWDTPMNGLKIVT